MIHGEKIEVGFPVEVAQDAFNASAVQYRWQAVDHVIVAPGATTDLDATRPEGVSVAFTLHFPKTFDLSVRGCRVKLRGLEYAVIGDPQPYTMNNVPGSHWLPVEVRRVEG